MHFCRNTQLCIPEQCKHVVIRHTVHYAICSVIIDQKCAAPFVRVQHWHHDLDVKFRVQTRLAKLFAHVMRHSPCELCEFDWTNARNKMPRHSVDKLCRRRRRNHSLHSALCARLRLHWYHIAGRVRGQGSDVAVYS